MIHGIKLDELLYFLASIIGISSFFLTNILLLRSLYMVSSALFVLSGFLYHINIIIIMNSLYFLVNGVQVIRLLLEHSTIILPKDLKPIYNKIFYNMTPREFLSFIKLGNNKSAENNEFLCHEGESTDHLLLILSGAVAIEKHSKKIATLSDYFFIGEMHFLTKKPMSTDVRAETPVHYLEWSHDQINRLHQKKPEVYMKILASIGRDLITKIQQETMPA
ncbi:cyclic nucleotide-binding protein [Legionella nautarum]|uniref:Cyclic nucleotide-binding protein n=1 Tax=Legionella nautarum TaxID=45070 RepID=A0A0W0WKA8_9GAMM|nr:cyclic nucleotide-binding domain-containing protein [Legionella nautarum]KTD32764.1 cyclic nucleotide-binding protein [Legionella nautarum]